MKHFLQGLALFLVLSVAFLFLLKMLRPQSDFLTTEERDWLQSQDQRLVVATDPRWQPNEAVADQKIYKGLSDDFLALVERKLGIRLLRLYAQSWEQVLEAEKQGKIDIHPVLVGSTAHSGNWLYTRPYMQVPVVVVMRESLKERFTPELMPELRMGVGHGYGVDAFMRAQGGAYNLVPVESDLFGLLKASLGEIDLMVTDLASASYHIEKEGLTNLRLAATLGSLYEFSFASRRDLPMLNSILNKALAQITREERRQIYERWIVFDVQPFYENRSFWYAAGIALLIVAAVLGLVMIWNFALKVEVASKTKALQTARDELEERVQERTKQLAQANVALEREMSERAQMAAEILHISGYERARIGRDLHDSIGQQMVGIACLSRALAGRFSDPATENARSAARIADQIDHLVVDMKRIVKGVLPVDVMDKGLLAAITQLARETSQGYGVECEFECRNEDACRIRDNAMATNLYRIVQEAIGNAAKHAKGVQRIRITLDVADERGMLRIRDNGAGIQTQQPCAGMGLKIMRYRASLAGGHLAVHAMDDGGTEVECTFNPSIVLNEDTVS